MVKVDENLRDAVKLRFGVRGEPGYRDTSPKGKNFVQVWTPLGKSLHYEYFQDDGEVQLHFEGKFKGEKYRYLRNALKKTTENNPKYPSLKWDTWQRQDNCRCRYCEELNSVEDILDAFEKLINVFDQLILIMIEKNKAMNEYIKLLESNHNLILTGAPGTGKTYLAREIADAMGAETAFVQFHPSYDYTDFVEGLRPNDDGNGNIGFVRMDGVFKAFCKEAMKNKKNKEKKYVFIIDEINRGDISKILGELFFSIDPGYRGEKGKVKTQYQNLIEKGDEYDDGFYVPENVYIIGTMNDIDRSVESMDFAMRRRFAWKEITAEMQIGMLDRLLKKDDDIKYPMVAEDIEKVKNRLTNLNNEIVKEKYGLSAAYHIGPSYFLKLGLYEGDRFESLWENHIKGVLYEYLRGNEKIDVLIEDLRKAYNKDNDKLQNNNSKVIGKQE